MLELMLLWRAFNDVKAKVKRLITTNVFPRRAPSITAIFPGHESAVCFCVAGIRFICNSIQRCHTRRLEGKRRISRGNLVPFTYKDIRSMTRNFADEIGRGGYGSVCKRHIGDTVVVAVKRLDNVSAHETEIMNKVESVGYIHHKNLVNLQDYCRPTRTTVEKCWFTSTWSAAPLTGHYLEHLIPKVPQILISTSHPFLSGGRDSGLQWTLQRA